MNFNETCQEMRNCAGYLRGTRLPVGEKEAIERILTCAALLEKLADDMEHEKTNEEG